ncbi:MAG: glycerol-3-phosphate 1-O-acyltransferase PlsY [Blastochloris sp.]|nr:glycerol-3-phosphate 1-O-acyltransferase PlsY [Blastochloris sp.]
MDTTVILTIGMMIAGYLSGSIPFSYLVARAHGVDLRTVGSGNIGGANVWRACGFRAFLIATMADILKGLLPTLAALYLAGLPAGAVITTGMSAIIGHIFPVFLNFKGGKAVATSGGVLLATVPLLLLVGLIAWVLAFLVTRISSLGSLTAAVVVCVLGTWMFATARLALPYALFVWVGSTFIVYLHRDNIRRLRAGTENRFERLR